MTALKLVAAVFVLTTVFAIVAAVAGVPSWWATLVAIGVVAAVHNRSRIAAAYRGDPS